MSNSEGVERHFERGFAQYKTVGDSPTSLVPSGRAYVRLYESSSAEGAFVWLNVKGEAHLDEAPRPFVGIPGGLAAGSISAYLSVELVKAVRDGLDEFIREHDR
jgi:hypothetical protein